MSGLAHLLLSQKAVVTGSDTGWNAQIEALVAAGAVIYKGQSAEQVTPDATVVYSSDIKEDNSEYHAAIRLQRPLLHRSVLLSQLLKGYRSLAVTGTHGKTTTSALLATVLVNAQLDPSFAVGGVLAAFQSNARFGRGQFFAFEADESDRSFLNYHPFGAIVTNIDRDHLSHYEGSETVLIQAFKTFMTQVESSSHLFWCGDDEALVRLKMPGQSYGFRASCDWKITAIRQEGFRMFFDLEHQEKSYPLIELALIGRHNALNGAAVFGLAITLGIDERVIRETFRTFSGVSRRCERKGMCDGMLFLDDYAHHPTEVLVTLQGIRQAIEKRRLIVVFQPHRYSRTEECRGLYGNIFDAADELIITDIYGAGETSRPDLSHTLIQDEVKQASKISCHYVPRSALSHYLSRSVQPHDVVVTLGAGDITKVGTETLVLLEQTGGGGESYNPV